MAMLLGVVAMMLLLGLSLAVLKTVKRLSAQLSVTDETFRHWIEQDHLELSRFKPVFKRMLIALTGLFWLLGVGFSAVYEGVAYTLLVAALGWAPAVALGFAATGVLTLVLKILLVLNFTGQWLVKARQARKRMQAAGSAERQY